MPSDLEITRLCSEAMGLRVGTAESWERFAKNAHECWCHQDNLRDGLMRLFDPLHDDAQAMALVKKFGVAMVLNDGVWEVGPSDSFSEEASSPDLNRAICLCVAHLQSAKERE